MLWHGRQVSKDVCLIIAAAASLSHTAVVVVLQSVGGGTVHTNIHTVGPSVSSKRGHSVQCRCYARARFLGLERWLHVGGL
jgi:hypothetical protein